LSSRCSCNIAGLLSVNYSGIISASINGGTTIEISEEGVVLIGPTINNLNISAYPFSPGGDWFLGATCPSSANAQIQWVTKYDCFNDETYFIPQSGGKASIVGGPINNVYLGCDPNIISIDFNASAQAGPTTPYTKDYRKDGFNLVYTGNPIAVNSGSPKPYLISLGEFGTLRCYLQSFNLSITPPSPSTVSYSFVFLG
jgi:hypothetical protein